MSVGLCLAAYICTYKGITPVFLYLYAMDISKSYITIQGWMIEKLHLKGNELIAFGLIFGFCQDRNSKFTGSLNFVRKWLGASSKTTAVNVLNKLVEQNLLIKHSKEINKIIFNEYEINWATVNEKTNTIPKNDRGCTKKCNGGVPKNGTNNIINNTHKDETDLKTKVIEETAKISHAKKAVEFEKYLFETTQGSYALNAIKENRTIKKKNFSDIRMVDEIFNFFTHHQRNNFLLTQDVSSHILKAEFEKWLTRDLCKPDKQNTQKIYNTTDHIEKFKTMFARSDDKNINTMEALCFHYNLIDVQKYQEVKKKLSKLRLFNELRARLIKLLKENKVTLEQIKNKANEYKQ